MTAVLVSHPHVAPFASGLARRLAERDQLAAFISGVAFASASWSGRAASALATRYPVAHNRILDLPASALRSLAPVELGARAAAAVLKSLRIDTKAYDAMFVAHDAAVALMPWPAATTDVYAYEDGALRTFERARRRGIGRVWDLPLPHYATIQALFEQEARRWPEAGEKQVHREPAWKRQRKDGELALATKISVASDFTRQSLEPLAPLAPVFVTPYGFPIDAFAARDRRPAGPFTVLAVGTQDLRKGTPYLLEAWRRADLPDAELHLIGPMRLAKTFLDRYAGRFRHWPHLPKTELPARYAAADLLAFPTLGDGFGIVIQEAMCCGTPVVTTPCGGGPECITDGVDGWLIPARDVDALADRLRAAAADRERTFAVGKAARTRAERWTWRDAGDALAKALEA